MRAYRLTPVALLLFACGEPPSVTLPAARSQALGLDNNAAFDALVGQLTERGRSATRTDAGSFGQGGSVALGVGSPYLYVADQTNFRVLGFANSQTVQSGDAATLVLNQDDFATTDFRNVSLAQRLIPYTIATDPEDRLYVADDIVVLVFEDPFTEDRVVDYKLQNPPEPIVSIRYLPDTNLIAVMSPKQVVIYERGNPAPYAQGSFPVPCPDLGADIAFANNVYFVACSGNTLCADNATPGCSGVWVYEANSVTGFVAQPLAPYRAFTFMGAARQMALDESRLLIADSSGNRVIRLSTTAVSWAQNIIGGAGTIAPASLSAGLTVYGQPNEVSTVANYHASGVPQLSAGGLSSPWNLAVDPDDHRLWVADINNSRLLAFSDVTAAGPVETAQVVLGQPDMTHGFPNRLEANAFATPAAVALGPSGGNLRAVAADSGAHRVLIFDDFNHYQTGDDPDFVLGQSTSLNYQANNGQASINASGLSGPTGVAISPNGWVWVCDTNNQRVLAFENPSASGANANRVYGAANLTEAGVYGNFSRIAATNTHLFVAAGNRVLMYDVNIQQRKPVRVFGQEQPPAGNPLVDDIGNSPNRGGGARADTLANVTDVAVDADGRLWVADSGNYRVLWFDNPAATTGSLTDHLTADGVVGQPDFTSNTLRMNEPLGAFAFFGALSLAVADDGTLWVADQGDSRVLAFFSPMTVDPNVGVPVAGLVLGQPDFHSNGANNANNGVSSQTLHGPVDIAVDGTGRTLLVSDRGNYRLVRAIANRPPIIQGAGTFEVEPGETVSVTLTVTDPEGDAFVVSGVEPVPAGAVVSSTAVTYTAPANAPMGNIVPVNVVAVDSGLRGQGTTATVAFQVVLHHTTPGNFSPRQPRPAPEEPGCVCSSGPRTLAWLLLLPGLVWTGRRRRAG